METHRSRDAAETTPVSAWPHHPPMLLYREGPHVGIPPWSAEKCMTNHGSHSEAENADEGSRALKEAGC